jgi:predicted phosphohydrolase
MVSLHIISDIHVEDGTKLEKVLCPDSKGILVLAGDLTRVATGSCLFVHALADICSKYHKVIFIPGNHEYYCIKGKTPMSNILKSVRSMTKNLKNLIVLDNETYTIGNTIIFGSTFWSYSTTETWQKIPMYVGKKGNEQLITNHEYNELHLKSLIALERAIKEAEQQDKKIVVVTHYPPTNKGAVDPKYQDSPNQSMYYSHNDHILENKVIIRWVFGHSDWNQRYERTQGVYAKLLTNQAVTKDFMNPLILII